MKRNSQKVALFFFFAQPSPFCEGPSEEKNEVSNRSAKIIKIENQIILSLEELLS